MRSSFTLRIFSALLTLLSLLWAVPSYADPVRNPAIATPRRIHPNPDICEQVTPRSDGGHGRRPGALVVPVAVHLEVQDASGRFLGANSSENIADVA
ncbi:MAG: hypothetical protein AAB853_04935, partial [Patescibacteria group bacterium]